MLGLREEGIDQPSFQHEGIGQLFEFPRQAQTSGCSSRAATDDVDQLGFFFDPRL